MGLQSALSTALTGLQAAETTIDVIGNNVANSNTVGYKQSDVIFATQFLQTLSIGSAPSASTGGTNPRQIGLGVKVAQISPDFSQGTIEISSNPLDLAIQGDGFLVVQGEQGQPLYTRNGQLSLNSANEIVNSSGNKLLGYTVNDDFELDTASTVTMEIPLGSERVAQATSEAVFAGVLNPTVQAGTIPGTVSSETLGNNSVESPEEAVVPAIRTLPDPPSGITTFNTGGATGLTTGTYRYRVTFRDADGNESSPSTEISVAVTDPNERIDLSGLPTETSPYTTTVLYRTAADGSAFHEVTSFASTTTTFSDTLDDATLLTNGALDANTIDAGNYRYYVTYRNSSTGLETRPTAQIDPVAIDNNTSTVRLDLSAIAAPDDAQFNQIRIYRNQTGDSSTFYRVDDLAVGTNSYIDNTASSALATEPTLDFDGPRASSATLLTDVLVRDGLAYTSPFQLGTLTFGAEQGGADLVAQNFDISATSTVGDLLEFMTDALGLHESSNVPDVPLPSGSGSIAISDGVITVVSNFGERNQIDIPLTAFQLQPTGSSITQTVDVLFSEVPPAANGPGTSSEFLVYDSLGSPIRVRLTTVLESSDSNSTTYRWYANSGDSQPALPDQTIVTGNGLLVFDSTGDLVSSPNARISIQRELTASQSPLEIDLDFSSVTSLAETNAAGEAVSSMGVTSQDGFPPGVLTDFIITETGLIQGQFSNGTQRTLGQVVMARFANNQGLEQLGDSLFGPSVNSGEALIGTPGEDGLGSLTAGAVELSNTDIGQDLVQMILAQTQYQAGSRVIAATQELLDELLSLQR